MKLHDLRPAKGSHTAPRRVGRGHGSGRGKTAGRGTKGQKSRAGGNLPAWFEGGQTPLHVRTPKLHGFRNRGRVEYAPLNLARLTEVASGTLITPEVLAHDGLVGGTKQPIKVLGVGDAPKGVTIHAHAFSKSALDKLSAAGSTVQRLSWPDNAPIELETPPRKKKASRRAKRSKAGKGDAAAADADATAEPADAATTADDADGSADAAPEASEAADEEGESEA